MKLSLSRKPDAVAWSVEDLLEKVRDGQIRLPEFQRLFKWDADDVLQLFDSIVRGFPLGTLLFWKKVTPADTDGRALEGVVASAAASSADLLWVLDGQQRLTSLAGVLLGPADQPDERFRIGFALDRDELIKVPSGEPWPESTLPLAHALDSVNLLTWLGDHRARLGSKAERRAMEVSKAIREYRIPAYIVLADDEETARLIFDRTNSAGKRLTKTDVFTALHEGLSTQQPSSLEQLEKSVEDLGFGPLRDSLFLQATAAVAGLDVTKMDHEALTRRELRSALPVTASALRMALVFLRQDAHIPNSALLPYGFPVIALTRFFHLYPNPHPRSRELLARWVWRGAITQKHWTHEQAYVRETLRTLGGLSEQDEVQLLLSQIPSEPAYPELGEYNLRAASTRLQLLALLDLRPRDLASGETIDGATLIAAKSSAAVLPLFETKSGDAQEDAARGSIFGRVIQKPMRHDRLIELLTGMHVQEPVLESLGLDAEDVRALRSGKPEPVALRRSQRLAGRFKAFFDRRARWGESDRPSLDSLVVEDES